LYENFFGEYGLPDSFKEQVSIELKMFANGFALLHATGGDEQAAMQHFKTAASMMVTQDLMKQEAANQSNTLIQEPKLNALERENKEEAELRPADPAVTAYFQSQKDLVAKYHLPYPLPGSSTKILSVEGLMAMKNKDSSENDCFDFGSGDCEKRNDPPSAPTHNYNLGQIAWSGQILLLHNAATTSVLASNVPWGYFSHAGFAYSDRLNYRHLIDSMPIGYNEFEGWRNGVDYASFERYSKKYDSVNSYNISTPYMGNVIDMAQKYVGTPYSVTAGKGFPWQYGMYCSLFLWHAVYDSIGWDIDSNGGYYVLPDDLVMSNVLQYANVWNK